MPEQCCGEDAQGSLTVSRVIDPITRMASFTVSFPPDHPPDVYFDTNVWISMTRQDVETLETLKRTRGFRYRFSMTNYVELLSRIGRGVVPGWNNPFRLVRGAFRKIKRLCEREVLPSPEKEYLDGVALGHLVDPVWVADPGQMALAVDLVARAETLGDITGEGIQTVRSMRFPRWIVDPNHYFQLTETDETSMRHLVEELYQHVGQEIQRDRLDSLVHWFLKLATFFLLFRPSQRRSTLNTLTSDEKNRFISGFTYGAGRIFKAHITLVAVKTVDRRERVDPNDLYDALQLLTLNGQNRLFVTNENSFFRYQEEENIHRVIKWDGFRQSHA